VANRWLTAEAMQRAGESSSVMAWLNTAWLRLAIGSALQLAASLYPAAGFTRIHVKNGVSAEKCH